MRYGRQRSVRTARGAATQTPGARGTVTVVVTPRLIPAILPQSLSNWTGPTKRNCLELDLIRPSPGASEFHRVWNGVPFLPLRIPVTPKLDVRFHVSFAECRPWRLMSRASRLIQRGKPSLDAYWQRVVLSTWPMFLISTTCRLCNQVNQGAQYKRVFRCCLPSLGKIEPIMFASTNTFRFQHFQMRFNLQLPVPTLQFFLYHEIVLYISLALTLVPMWILWQLSTILPMIVRVSLHRFEDGNALSVSVCPSGLRGYVQDGNALLISWLRQ